MLFNTLDFALFLPIVFLLYWFVVPRSPRPRNAFVVAASCYFYACWDWRFLVLILVSVLIDYFVGMLLEKEESPARRKALLIVSLAGNLGMLGFFKYWNFFVSSFVGAFSVFGQNWHVPTLDIVLPVGISFYTFQTLSYTIDVYRRQIPATRDFLAFAAFVTFFPQLVAGPIERASHLLPQFLTERVFDYDKARDGLRQIVWGLFKKVVIADGCAGYVDAVFANPEACSGSRLLVGAVLFSFQIYGDFSGYSDIAIGVARLFGVDLMRNFAYPYFSRDMVEFWRRWHISLSTWFRDYLFQPLGGGRARGWRQVRAVLMMFLISGLWHGANWTFIVWGVCHALIFLVTARLCGNQGRKGIVAQGRWLPSPRELWRISFTFLVFCLTVIPFRSESLSVAGRYFAGMFSSTLFTLPELLPVKTNLCLLAFLVVEWLGREQPHAIARLPFPRPFRWLLYYSLIAAVLLADNGSREFIYFQF